MSSPPSLPPTPNFSRPLPSPYNNMGTPTRQPRATPRAASAGRMSSRPELPPRTSSARQLTSENLPPLSASLSQPSDLSTTRPSLSLRKMTSIQNLAARFPISPGPASAGGRIVERPFEREVSMNEFLKEQWKPQSSAGPSLHSTPEHPPAITNEKSTMGLRRQASFPGHERQLSRDSKASDKSDRTVVQRLLNRQDSNASLPTSATGKSKLEDTSGASTGSDQTVIKYPAILQPK